MYTVCKQVHNPTVIEHCVYCHFLNSAECNLVVAAFNELKVYRLVGETIDDSKLPACGDTLPTVNDADLDGNKSKVKLECLKTFPIYCEISSLKNVRLCGAQRDFLLLSFSDAKLSIVEYDPTTDDLNTLALHYFEDDDMKEGLTQFSSNPEIRVDPEGRCAALLTYGKNIIIIPFRNESGPVDEHDSNIANNTLNFDAKNLTTNLQSTLFEQPGISKLVLPPYKLSLNEKQCAQEKIHNIIDFQFLNGYYEPTLLILHEPMRTWSGRVAVRTDTCSMVALSLNVQQKVHPIIWSTSQLPYDCFSALPIPKPVGGVVIFSVNLLLYLNQSVPPYAVSLNTFADTTSSFTKTPQKAIKISLDCSKACFISHDKLVISLKNGELYVATLFSDGMRSIRSFHFEKSASSVITSCLTKCEEGYLFLGSRLGNSLLLKYIENPVEKNNLPHNVTDFLLDDELDENQPKASPVPEVLGEDVEPLSLPTEQNDSETLQTECINDVPIKSENQDEEETMNEDIVINHQDHTEDPQAENDASKMAEDPVEDDECIGNNDISDTRAAVTIENLDPEKNLEYHANGQIGEDYDMDDYTNGIGSNNNNNNNDTNNEQKPSDIGDWAAGDVALMKDPDELEVYGVEDNSEDKLPTSFSFELCDSLLNIGPCGRICMGEPAFISEDFIDLTDPLIELVTTSGYGKNGALCVLQRTIRPQIVTTFGLPKCLDMWTVYGQPDDFYSDEATSSYQPPYHSYLILTRTDSTIILKTDQEISELDHGGVSSHLPTVFAGNLLNNRYIVQVSPLSVRLLQGTKQIQQLSLELLSPVADVSLVDPYVMLLTHSGEVVQLNLSNNLSSPTISSHENIRLDISRPFSQRSKISAICLYKDVSGKFTTKLETCQLQVNVDNNSRPIKTELVEEENKSKATHVSTIDDEDELLYGSSMVETVRDISENQTDGQVYSNGLQSTADTPDDTPKSIPILEEHEPSFWLFVVYDNGAMEIFSIPEFKSVFYCKYFSQGHKVLCDNFSPKNHETKSSSSTIMPIIKEITVVGMGLKKSRPVLFARTDKEIMTFEVFPYFNEPMEDRLRIRFSRKDITLIAKDSLFGHDKNVKSGNQSNEPLQNESLSNFLTRQTMHHKMFRPFSDIAGYSGIFICGPSPHWCFMTTRGELRVHEMNIDGPVSCFAPFHNVNCSKGFLYFNENEELRIALLPTHVTYDACWPVRKVPLRCNINFVNYHVDSKCYCVVTSVQEIYKKLVRVGGEEKDYDELKGDSRYLWPTMERFNIELFSPVSWEFIPGTKISLDEWEHVTCVKNVMLNSEGTESGFKGYIALGTNYCYGEDVTNRGRIWILDIIDVVPEFNLPLTRSKIKIVYCKEQKGPVTAICQINGLLLSAVGQKIYIWQLKEAQLVGVAFIDTQIYIHQAVSIKNLILVADVFKSISLLRYQDDTRTLALASRESNSFEVYACEFLVDDSQLCFLVADGQKNLLIYSYQPEVRESNGGTRLIRRGDYHLGSHVNSIFRIRCKYPRSLKHDHIQKNNIYKRHVTIFPTIDGTINFMLPIGVKTYRRLYMLQNIMNSHIQHPAGINPKGVHMVKFQRKMLTNPMRNVLDGDLLFRFLSLSSVEKADLCSKISSTTDQIIDDLQEIQRLNSHF